MTNELPESIRRQRVISVFRNRYGELFNDEVVSPSGTPGRYLRWRWSFSGVVAVPAADDRVALVPAYRYPAGAAPRRVLEPLLSLLAMHGLIDVPGGPEAFARGEAAAWEAVPAEGSAEGSADGAFGVPGARGAGGPGRDRGQERGQDRGGEEK